MMPYTIRACGPEGRWWRVGESSTFADARAWSLQLQATGLVTQIVMPSDAMDRVADELLESGDIA